MAQTRAVHHTVKRPCAGGPDGPKTGGSGPQVQPVEATKKIAAGTSRSEAGCDDWLLCEYGPPQLTLGNQGFWCVTSELNLGFFFDVPAGTVW